jgi:hypothetical protein
MEAEYMTLIEVIKELIFICMFDAKLAIIWTWDMILRHRTRHWQYPSFDPIRIARDRISFCSTCIGSDRIGSDRKSLRSHGSPLPKNLPGMNTQKFVKRKLILSLKTLVKTLKITVVLPTWRSRFIYVQMSYLKSEDSQYLLPHGYPSARLRIWE